MSHDFCWCHKKMSIRERLWWCLARFCYRRVRRWCTEMPVGTPTIRDPQSPCSVFEPGRHAGFRCPGDGHYLCGECCHYDEEAKL